MLLVFKWILFFYPLFVLLFSFSYLYTHLFPLFVFFLIVKLQAAVLSAECFEEAKKVKDALGREEVLKRIAAEEKAKHLEAIKELEEAKELLAKEALDRHKAENVASSVFSEKFKVLDSLFSSGKHCRRYSKEEIEVATDNFSESKKIGEGGYGKVYKCNLDHTPVAVKVLRQDRCDKKEEFIREVCVKILLFFFIA